MAGCSPLKALSLYINPQRNEAFLSGTQLFHSLSAPTSQQLLWLPIVQDCVNKHQGTWNVLPLYGELKIRYYNRNYKITAFKENSFFTFRNGKYTLRVKFESNR